MTMFQCAPEPDDVLATRRLPDGRELAVFRLTEERRAVSVERIVSDVVAGEVIVGLVRKVSRTSWSLVTLGYALVVTDDTGAPEKWRTLDTRKSRHAVMRLFANFKEGDDDRRTRQVAGHLGRRAADAAPRR